MFCQPVFGMMSMELSGNLSFPLKRKLRTSKGIEMSWTGTANIWGHSLLLVMFRHQRSPESLQFVLQVPSPSVCYIAWELYFLPLESGLVII
jgi:hypothetical protein